MKPAQIKQVAAIALQNIARILDVYLPGGKTAGNEYQALNPTRADSKPGSFSVNLTTGAWADFATDDKGGDLVSLVAYLQGRKNGQAAEELAKFLGMEVNPKPAAKPVSDVIKPPETPEAAPEWAAVLPVPDDAPKPPKKHPRFGSPSRQWLYRDADGNSLCWVYRFEVDGGKKQFFPLTYCSNSEGARAWRWQGLDAPRPLYHLDEIHNRPSAPVIVCEGEKAADAAAELFPNAVITTMLNGAQSPHKTNWKPLDGRWVWLWPDNDAPGLACMAKVAKLAQEAGASSVEVFDLTLFSDKPVTRKDLEGERTPSRELPQKWDAADALAEGWHESNAGMLLNSGRMLLPADSLQAVTTNPAKTKTKNMPRDFVLNEDGVWYSGKNDTGEDAPPLWICSRLEITAATRDDKNENWGRLLEFPDADGELHHWAMPMELLKGDGSEYRGALLSMGVQIAQSGKARNLLTQYIQTTKTSERARCVERTGWHGAAFVLPSESIGEVGERLILQTAHATANTFKRAGTLEDWRTHVAALCVGNSRMIFATSAAFAAPLIHLIGAESCGIHLYGGSRSGKTTTLQVAASVWGGVDYVQRWRATDNGLESLAAQHSDCLLALDEISQLDSKIAGEVVYMLGNGSGKARANKNQGLRDPLRWRTLFFSTGEKSLSEIMAAAGKKPQAGQEARMLNMQVDAECGYGAFENLHQYANSRLFSDAVKKNSQTYYGTAATAFLRALIEHIDKAAVWVRKLQLDFIASECPMDAVGQVADAAKRMAMIGAAGELATKFSITGWEAGTAMNAAKTCFSAWLKQRGGNESHEDITILKQIRLFFEMRGEDRFTLINRSTADDDRAPKTLNRAGYRKHSTKIDGEFMTEYFVFPEVFRSEICSGIDYKKACALLKKLGCLKPEGDAGYTRSERLPDAGKVRVYVITSEIFSCSISVDGE